MPGGFEEKHERQDINQPVDIPLSTVLNASLSNYVSYGLADRCIVVHFLPGTVSRPARGSTQPRIQ
jgi:hypothetical protein